MTEAPSGLSWGILGAARIATRRLIPAIPRAGGVVQAIASREAERAEDVARVAGAVRAYGSYEALLEDCRVEAIYVPLPNHLHVPWSIRALEAGKHVLVEKPVGQDADEARALQAVAANHPGLIAMEAFMYRFHPRWQALHRMVADGDLGDVTAVHTHFSYHNVDPANVRNMPGIGGGGLLDIGCYGVSVARWLFGAEPSVEEARVEMDPAFGVDRLATARLRFAGGEATLLAATQQEYRQDVKVICTDGSVSVPMPFNPTDGEPCRLEVRQGGTTTALEFPPTDQYAEMVAAFQSAARGGGPAPLPLADAVANMTVLDAIRAAAA